MAFGAAAMLPTGAMAYREYKEPAALIARHDYDAVILAEIVDADIGFVEGVESGWRGTAKIQKPLVGNAEAQLLSIGRTGQSTMCDDGIFQTQEPCAQLRQDHQFCQGEENTLMTKPQPNRQNASKQRALETGGDSNLFKKIATHKPVAGKRE